MHLTKTNCGKKQKDVCSIRRCCSSNELLLLQFCRIEFAALITFKKYHPCGDVNLIYLEKSLEASHRFYSNDPHLWNFLFYFCPLFIYLRSLPFSKTCDGDCIIF